MSATDELAKCVVPLTGAAAVRLYDDHVDAVHALVTRRVGPIVSPQVTGEAFGHAMLIWDRFDRDRGTERLFLFGAAVAVIRHHEAQERVHLNSLRSSEQRSSSTVADPLVPGSGNIAPRVVDHAANRDLLDDGGPGDTPASNNDSSSDDVALTMAAVSELASDDRDVLLLSLWESCSQSDIAEALGLSVGSVRSALGRIRRELKLASSPSRSDKKRRR